MALCAGLLGAKALFHLRQYHSLRSAFDSAKADVKQLASDEREVVLPAAGSGEAAPPARGTAGQPAAPSAAAQQQDRTPAVGTGGRLQAAPEVSPLIQRGEAAASGLGHTCGVVSGSNMSCSPIQGLICCIAVCPWVALSLPNRLFPPHPFHRPDPERGDWPHHWHRQGHLQPPA